MKHTRKIALPRLKQPMSSKTPIRRLLRVLRTTTTKLIEFTQANTNAAYDFVPKLSGVKSPSVFVELSTEHARKQFETLTEQTKQLAALAQKVMLATAEPLKTGVAKAQEP